ncbi:trypsin-like peptidase domain-containing protein [Flavobacteriaceae bacterium]|jgi:Do/DeqQ family serine protease|nr:trypsin-like peptidase domain-containing protein [Flavobacteriaceae bacterium]
MKKILTLVLVSALGGAITLSTYKYFIEEKPIVVKTHELIDLPPKIATNYKTNKSNLESLNPNFVTAAENTINTVVHVQNTAIGRRQMTMEDLFFGRQSQRPQIGTGSGVIISSDGYIITNNHVIDGAESIMITTNNNKTFDAKLIGTDPKTDIALLKINAENELPYSTFGDSDASKIGEWVLAVGNPFNLNSTVTAGIISAKSRNLDQTGTNTQSFLQTDAAVNPGNSGGALVNIRGELIGINTAITSQTGSYIGYSFAVPSNIARKVIADIMEFGNVQNGILGVMGGELNGKNAEDLGVNETEGFFISDVQKASGAYNAGLKSGDIIKKINETNITKFADLKGFLSTKRPNDVVNVTILRDSKITIIPVTLYKNMTVNIAVIGTLKKPTKEELKEYNLDYGLVISNLNSRYKGDWIADGVNQGSLVTTINGEKLKTVEQVEQLLEKRSEYEPMRIEIIKENGEKVNYRFK